MRKFISSLPAPEQSRRWYYDACALESRVYLEISNLLRKHATVAVTSHLALGEAFGNCLRKSKERDKPEILKSFLQFITDLNNAALLHVVGHDDVLEQYDSVRARIGRINIADAMQLATALKNQCSQVRTTDADLLGLNKKHLQQVAEQYGITGFCCSKVG
ncbi:MAG: PIN domain-containing protein [Candidatus Woesearchaeota archaeon]|nr:PIN domain-containing protein [Candidatus Woesearchaeota archaeon]